MICISIVAERQSEALQMIQNSASLADVLELRMDLLSDGNLAELMGAVRSHAPYGKVLVTNRQSPLNPPSEKGGNIIVPPLKKGGNIILPFLAKGKNMTLPFLIKGENKVSLPLAEGESKKTSPLAKGRDKEAPPLAGEDQTIPPLAKGEDKEIPPLAKGGMGGFGGFGGHPSEKERIGVLLEAVFLGADFVDIELATAPVWRERVRAMIASHGSRTALIVSHHDFFRTPSRKTLIGIFSESVQAGASIVKIVTLARTPQDNLAVLGLIPYARRRKKDIIAFCMGKEGKISRVMAPLLGAFFTFASLKRGAESGAGQLTIGEMRRIYRILGRV